MSPYYSTKDWCRLLSKSGEPNLFFRRSSPYFVGHLRLIEAIKKNPSDAFEGPLLVGLFLIGQVVQGA